jgi:hypothetical protein
MRSKAQRGVVALSCANVSMRCMHSRRPCSAHAATAEAAPVQIIAMHATQWGDAKLPYAMISCVCSCLQTWLTPANGMIRCVAVRHLLRRQPIVVRPG